MAQHLHIDAGLVHVVAMRIGPISLSRVTMSGAAMRAGIAAALLHDIGMPVVLFERDDGMISDHRDLTRSSKSRFALVLRIFSLSATFICTLRVDPFGAGRVFD